MAPAATAIAAVMPTSRPERNVRGKILNMRASLPMTLRGLNLRCLTDDHFCADRHALIKIDDFRIDQTETSGCHRAADGLRLVGAVDAINRIAEIKGARTHRIARTARHET